MSGDALRADGASTEGSRVPAGAPPAGLPPLVLVGLYIGLGLLPLVLAALQGVPARGLWRELSSGLAMVGVRALYP